MKESEINWMEGFGGHIFLIEKLFTSVFHRFPNEFIYSFGDDKVDTGEKTIKSLREAYPNAVIKINNYKTAEKTSCVDDEETDYDSYYYHREIKTIKLFDNNLFISIDEGNAHFYYIDIDIEEEVKRLLSVVSYKKDENKEAVIGLVAFSGGDYYTIDSKIEPTTVDINANYNDDFLPVYDDLTKFLNERKSGLVVLRGEVGTGKTRLIKHLITNCPKEYILITNSVSSSLASPEFISFMISCKNSVFILEDCEQILLERGSNNLNNAISSILNISDGLMSDIFNIKFICTFNADINKIDKALLRKGRCFANYEFKKLSVEKTKNLLNSLGIFPDTYREMTLAEIYNYEDIDCSSTNKLNKIGFNVS